MKANEDYDIDFEGLVYELKEDYPNLSEFEIRNILEERLLALFKEHIIEMEIPQNITLKDLRTMRGRIKIMQKSHRWDRRIDSIIKKYNKDRYFLKIKGIQYDLKTWDKFTENNNFSSIINGSSLKYFDGTQFEINGIENVDTKLESKELRKNQSQVDIEEILINNGGYELKEDDLKTDFGSYKDSVKMFEKSYRDKEDEVYMKIPIDHDLLERIKSVKIKPMVKKETQNLDIEDLIDDLNKLNDK